MSGMAGMPGMAGMAHGNHNPKYGGTVLMNGDMHFEVVLNRDGTYHVYFSDARAQRAARVDGVRRDDHGHAPAAARRSLSRSRSTTPARAGSARGRR